MAKIDTNREKYEQCYKQGCQKTGVLAICVDCIQALEKERDTKSVCVSDEFEEAIQEWLDAHKRTGQDSMQALLNSTVRLHDALRAATVRSESEVKANCLKAIDDANYVLSTMLVQDSAGTLAERIRNAIYDTRISECQKCEEVIGTLAEGAGADRFEAFTDGELVLHNRVRYLAKISKRQVEKRRSR